MVQASGQDTSWERCFGRVQQGEDHEGDPGHAGETPGWPLECLGVLLEELGEVAEKRNIWSSLLKMLPLQPRSGKVQAAGWMSCTF